LQWSPLQQARLKIKSNTASTSNILIAGNQQYGAGADSVAPSRYVIFGLAMVNKQLERLLFLSRSNSSPRAVYNGQSDSKRSCTLTTSSSCVLAMHSTTLRFYALRKCVATAETS
jgi:hypothetical protein